MDLFGPRTPEVDAERNNRPDDPEAGAGAISNPPAPILRQGKSTGVKKKVSVAGNSPTVHPDNSRFSLNPGSIGLGSPGSP